MKTVPLPNDDQLPAEIVKILKELPPINVFRMVANVPTSFIPFIDFAKSLLALGKFDPKLREIAILRVAHLTKSPYEWHQHYFIAQSNGVTDHEAETVRRETPVHSLTPEANFVCQVADELTLNVGLSEKTRAELYQKYNIEVGTELIFVLSYFNMLSRFLNGTNVQIESTNPLEGLDSPVKK